MDFKLHILKQETDDYYQRYHLCFTVVDLSKSQSYPSNYVCILPIRIKKGGTASKFEKLFKERSVYQAKILLKEALNKVDDLGVRVELERRLKSLEPKKIREVKCSDCGKLFLSCRVRRFKNNFCEACMKKNFGRRE